MTYLQQAGVLRGRSLFIWLLFCVTSGATLLVYGFTSQSAGQGHLLMPLDDSYIHFQYARSLASGQPYQYNPDLPPTSGATSFLYPYILAVGYAIGFQGLNLGWWALLVGALALLGCMMLVRRLLRRMGASDELAVGMALALGWNGAVAWHAMSGMETGLVILLLLASLDQLMALALLDVPASRLRLLRISLILSGLVLIRPEGGALALVTIGLLWLWGWRRRELLLPILAFALQPLVNLLLTGSLVASGNAAKSIFGAVPFDWSLVIGRWLEQCLRVWAEFISGSSPREGLYLLPYVTVLLAASGMVWLLRSQSLRLIGWVVLAWLLVWTAAIGTLDTAFWHFKRYQMPLLALLFPLAGWGLLFVGSTLKKGFAYRWMPRVVVGLLLVVAGLTTVQFWRAYALNIGYVYAQPYQMARWLEENTPSDALIAVHDVGMMRYAGGRTTLDMVGLTTPGAAEYWRNGPGAVAEWLVRQRPDYIASYGPGHGYGLGMIADTDLYGEPLAVFPVKLDNQVNVALAADFQGIYRPNWSAIQHGLEFAQRSLAGYIDFDAHRRLHHVSRGLVVDVAESVSERRARYQWMNRDTGVGFPTEVHQLTYPDCAIDSQGQEICGSIIDGGRNINGEETFQVGFVMDSGQSGADMVLVTRLHPTNRGTFDVFVNEEFVARRWIPQMPGVWLDVATFIPSRLFSNPMTIRIVPRIESGYYAPYQHSLYRFSSVISASSSVPLAQFQDGAFRLDNAEWDYDAAARTLNVQLHWHTEGSAQGDYRRFVHLYADVNQPPLAQADGYVGGGTLPPGNWLPGVLNDAIALDLAPLPPGRYSLAIGFYDPYTGARLGSDDDGQGRVFVGEVEIPP